MNRRLPLRTLKLVIEQATGNRAMRSDALLAALASGLFELQRQRFHFGFDWIASIVNRVGDPLDRTKRIRIIDIQAFPAITFFWPDDVP